MKATLKFLVNQQNEKTQYIPNFDEMGRRVWAVETERHNSKTEF